MIVHCKDQKLELKSNNYTNSEVQKVSFNVKNCQVFVSCSFVELQERVQQMGSFQIAILNLLSHPLRLMVSVFFK